MDDQNNNFPVLTIIYVVTSRCEAAIVSPDMLTSPNSSTSVLDLHEMSPFLVIVITAIISYFDFIIQLNGSTWKLQALPAGPLHFRASGELEDLAAEGGIVWFTKRSVDVF